MSNELDDVAKSLFLGHIPHIWRKLAPDTLKSLGNWMTYFLRRFSQYTLWVSEPRVACPGPPCLPRPPALFPRSDLCGSSLSQTRPRVPQARGALCPCRRRL